MLHFLNVIVQHLMDKKIRAIMFPFMKQCYKLIYLQRELNLIPSESFLLTAGNRDRGQSYPICEYLWLHY